MHMLVVWFLITLLIWLCVSLFKTLNEGEDRDEFVWIAIVAVLVIASDIIFKLD